MSQIRYIIAGNWKMNKVTEEAVTLTQRIHNRIGHITQVGTVVCPPFTALDRLGKLLEEMNSNVQLGAQNMHAETNGAYTGEIAADMLRDFFCGYVILGHSERRQYFGETDAFINKKVHTALSNKLRPILCIGETLDERNAGVTTDVVEKQIEKGLTGIHLERAEDLVIAYEPVWAIGTGKTATPEMAQEVHATIRERLAKALNEDLASKIRILYGGSMKPQNASDLLDQPDINGGLIGGASLDSESFCELVEIALSKAGH